MLYKKLDTKVLQPIMEIKRKRRKWGMWRNEVDNFTVSLVFLLITLEGLSQPILVIDDPIFDFGDAIDGAVLEHIFVLENTGDSSLRIVRIAHNCSCISYQIAKTKIGPGESISLMVRFNTTGYSVAPQPVRQTLTIYSKDPIGPHNIIVPRGILSARPTTSGSG